jgi:integrating conjugative element protein (TIGR03749 family)
MKKSLLIILLCSFPLLAYADRMLVWDKNPITIILPVGEEVRVTFPTDVSLQIPKSLISSLESLAPNQQIVYWKATQPFDKARVVAPSADNQTVYLIDLVTQENALAESLVIEDPDRVIAQHNDEPPRDLLEGVQDLLDPPEIVLTRFASQSLYAPRRLMPVNPDIATMPLVQIPANFPLMRSQKGEQYRLSVVGAWSGYGLHITAVLLINQSELNLAVNPGLVQGNFSHITPQHLQLGPKGSLEDRTTLYLISSVPFNAAIQEDGYGY